MFTDYIFFLYFFFENVSSVLVYWLCILTIFFFIYLFLIAYLI